MREHRLQPAIIENYRGNLALIKERIQLFNNNPAKTPPDLVRSMLVTQMTIEKKSTEFSDVDELVLLDRLEKWYTDQGFGFPNQEYLERQRARYKS